MRIELIPVKTYEEGDSVITKDGTFIVVHDELEGFTEEVNKSNGDFFDDSIAAIIKYRLGITVRPLINGVVKDEEIVISRYDILK